MLVFIMLFANLGSYMPSACNGMHAFALGTIILLFIGIYTLIGVWIMFKEVSSIIIACSGIVTVLTSSYRYFCAME